MRTLTNRGRAGGEDAWACGHGPGAAYSINDAGQAVGLNPYEPVEWSGGEVIVLGGPLGGHPYGINNSGQAVGYIYGTPVRIPEPSTWVMMLLGFAGLAFAGYRRAKAGYATLLVRRRRRIEARIFRPRPPFARSGKGAEGHRRRRSSD
jgi:hypothetical protein